MLLYYKHMVTSTFDPGTRNTKAEPFQFQNDFRADGSNAERLIATVATTFRSMLLPIDHQWFEKKHMMRSFGLEMFRF